MALQTQDTFQLIVIAEEALFQYLGSHTKLGWQAQVNVLIVNSWYIIYYLFIIKAIWYFKILNKTFKKFPKDLHRILGSPEHTLKTSVLSVLNYANYV